MPAKPWARAKAAKRSAARDHDAEWADHKCELLLAACHPEQRSFVSDPGRRITALVGRGGGKTTGGRARLVRRMLRTPKAKCVYIATTRLQAESLMWDPLKDLLERLGVEATFNETKLTCTLKRNGSKLRLIGADNKREIDKLRGQPFHEVGIDEGASYPAALLDALVFRIIGPRLGDYGGCLWIIGTPSHILQGTFYDASRPGSALHRPWRERDLPAYDGWARWSSHAWTLEDAGKTVAACARLWAEALVEKAANNWSDDNPIWLREYKGQWARDDTENIYKYRPHLADGTEWNQWDPERVGALRTAKLPAHITDWHFGYGNDMGSADPFALQVFAFSPSDPTRTLYHVYEFEERKMYARTIALLLVGADLDSAKPAPTSIMGVTGWPDAMVADMAGLGEAILDELSQVYGIKIAAANKEDKFAAIELSNGDFIDGRIKILKGSKLETQLLTLQWMQDEFGRLKEDKAQANHSTDAMIYIRLEISKLFASSGAPPPPAAAAPTAGPLPPHPAPAELEPAPAGGGEDDYSELLGDGGYGFDDGYGNL